MWNQRSLNFWKKISKISKYQRKKLENNKENIENNKENIENNKEKAENNKENIENNKEKAENNKEKLENNKEKLENNKEIYPLEHSQILLKNTIKISYLISLMMLFLLKNEKNLLKALNNK
ncbi:MAG: hypothetical protein LBP53_08085 [Candidatus Peribacteria bacterium]|nr:hypothetical protein [Candidatus Peribacteria bacterium]